MSNAYGWKESTGVKDVEYLTNTGRDRGKEARSVLPVVCKPSIVCSIHVEIGKNGRTSAAEASASKA